MSLVSVGVPDSKSSDSPKLDCLDRRMFGEDGLSPGICCLSDWSQEGSLFSTKARDITVLEAVM